MAKTLTREEAEEYTKNMGQLTTANYGLVDFAIHTLGVPKALGMTPDDWVQEKLGGYVRRSVDQRQEAVRELSGEQSPGGYYERSAKEVAETLGISPATVERDRTVIEAQQARAGSAPQIEAEVPARAGSTKNRALMAKLVKDGEKSIATIAVETGYSPDTVRQERAAQKKAWLEAEQPSPSLQDARKKKADELAAIPEHEKKAASAAVGSHEDAISGALLFTSAVSDLGKFADNLKEANARNAITTNNITQLEQAWTDAEAEMEFVRFKLGTTKEEAAS